MKFVFKKRINTIENSIFYSLIYFNNQILGFGKQRYNTRIIKQVVLDENFEIIEDNNNTFIGEDPRCFNFNNKLYITDNYWCDMHIIEYETHKYTKLNISGKNISFIEHNNELYFTHYLKPFILYKFDIETNTIIQVEVDDDKCEYNYEYRGGTPGYKLKENTYYGFGHRTYYRYNVLIHDIFKWVVYFDENKLPRIHHEDIEQPTNSKDICDPTSVIQVNGKLYLITAESDYPWIFDQDYDTNVYEIVTDVLA